MTMLPRIPESFIKAYVKANGINKVMVECYWAKGKDELDANGRAMTTNYEKLKLTDNNEVIISVPERVITITKVEEKMYSRDEVIALINKHRKETYNGYSSSKWIEENL